MISSLRTAGWIISGSVYDANAMGNWYVDLARHDLYLQIVKDRAQFYVSGPPIEELKAKGLWRAFDDYAEFQRAVVNWSDANPPV